MKHFWKQRVYIDLFSGPGCAQLRGSNKTLKGSPLLALSVPYKFDKYIFCDEKTEYINALQKRINKTFPACNVEYVVGDANEKVNEIRDLIPQHSKDNTVLSFCFVDPFDLGIHLNTLKTLSANKLVDYLILLALFMDVNRNEKSYTDPSSMKVDNFLGDRTWRERWVIFKKKNDSFPLFVAREFEKQILAIDYKKSDKENMLEFRSDEKNLPLYHLAYFSKHQKGYDFWGEAKKGLSEPPLDL